VSTRLWVSYSLESAHRLLGYAGKCCRLHGHNYRVTLVLERDGLDMPE
jgi:6-pyruvoyl-tetrahydropterin synthase